MATYESYLTTKEQLDTADYLNLSTSEKARIVSTRIIPPSLNPDGEWGKIEVEYDHPLYKTNT